MDQTDVLDFIRRIAHWLSLVLTPGAGTHRAGTQSARHPVMARPTGDLLPRHRSPYGLDLPLDGTATRLIRPYLAAYERERALRQRRRVTLVLAADFGIDLDEHLVGAGEVAT